MAAAGPSEGEEFGQRLKRMLGERGLKNADLAGEVDVSANTVSGWTTGKNVPKGENLQGIARALDTSVGVLLGSDTGGDGAESQALVRKLAELDLEPTVRAIAGVAPDLMAILSEAKRQTEQYEETNG